MTKKTQASIDGLDGLDDNPDFAKAAAAYHKMRKRTSGAKKQRDQSVRDTIAAGLNHELEPGGLRESVARLSIHQGEVDQYEVELKAARERLKGIIDAHEAG